MSNKLTSTTVGLAVLSGFVWASVLTPTGASAGTGTGACVQAGQAAFIVALDSPNDTEGGSLGDAVSDGFFGNEPNLPNSNDDLGPEEVDPGTQAGNVSPTLSPGPFVNGGGFTPLSALIVPTAGDCAEAD